MSPISSIKVSQVVGAKDKATGDMLLHITNNIQTVEWLLRKGADVNARNNLGKTPLHTAVERGAHEVAAKLVAAKDVDLSIEDANGHTPPVAAIRAKDMQMLQLLLTACTASEKRRLIALAGTMEADAALDILRKSLNQCVETFSKMSVC